VEGFIVKLHSSLLPHLFGLLVAVVVGTAFGLPSYCKIF